MIKIISTLLIFIFISSIGSAVLISDQGNNVRFTNGTLLDIGDLTISIYDNPSGGNMIFSTTINGAIVNGSWNLMINPEVQYGQIYWKDYEINGEDLDFDGNERLQFQSSSGLINNASFLNFSMIGSCSSGSAIMVVYSNGSVECESVVGGGVDLTNYALKNQSEIFVGNITTADSGLFGFLGSLASRITKLFVRDIDASGNIDATGNISATYILGDGSLLTNLPSAGSESDPIFVAENSTLWTSINSMLLSADQRYNETVLIISVNSTNNIMSLGFYNISQVNSLISNAANSSFNQTFTNSLYYSISNPSNFINQTQVSIYNDSILVFGVNSSLWGFINSNYVYWNSTYNVTYNHLLGQQCSSGMVVNGTLLNGSLVCTSISGSSNNIFNQNLNTTSNVSFANITAQNSFFSLLGSITNRVTRIFATDIDVSNNLSILGNVSAQFYLGSLNRSTFPTSSCQGSDKVIGLSFNGSIICDNDEVGGASQDQTIKFMNVLADAVTDTNAPTTERIVGNSQYLVCTNATGYNRFRYGFARSSTNGATNAIIYMKYISSPTTTITASSYTNLSNSVDQILSYTTANLVNLSSYYSMDNDLGDICIGAFQRGGDGVLDPQWRNIWVEISST